jgi:hypothetical protein
MNWQEISGSWVLIPHKPIGIVHFLGGAFVATAPQITYRWLLEQLAKKGYAIVATPFINTFDHSAIARQVLNRFERALERLQSKNLIASNYLPVYGIGHSMGCKLHFLIGSLFAIERAGNISISYNNYPATRAIPLMDTLDLNNTLNLNLEFIPSPAETQTLIAKDYQIRRNLLIRFNNDDLDGTSEIDRLLQSRFPNMVSTLTLPGNHLTPLSQELTWQTGDNFTPFDAIGQWFKQEFSRDLHRLQQEISFWLNPLKFIDN